jgi:RNA polymerase sigma-70 factor, ECF subfamily
LIKSRARYTKDGLLFFLDMANGQAKLFTEQINSCYGIILKICRLYGQGEEDRNDLRQDILLNAWSSFHQFRGEAKFSTWLYKVALNTAIGRLRKNRLPLSPLLEFHHDALPDQENERAEQVELLSQILRHLTDHEKAIVALYLEDLSYEEMAHITGLTESNVGVKLNRIKVKLKKISHENRT